MNRKALLSGQSTRHPPFNKAVRPPVVLFLILSGALFRIPNFIMARRNLK